MNFNKRDMSMKMAAVFQFGSRYISMGAQVVITMVLARLIAPADFGLVAIVCVFTGFFSLFSDMGISVAIIQYPDLTVSRFNREGLRCSFRLLGAACGGPYGFLLLHIAACRRFLRRCEAYPAVLCCVSPASVLYAQHGSIGSDA